MLRYIIITSLCLFYATIIFFTGVYAGSSKVFNSSMSDFYQLINSALSMEKEGSIDKNITVWNKDTTKSLDGFFLIGSFFINNPAIILVNSKGDVVHRWNVEKKIFNPDIMSLHKPIRKNIKDYVNAIEDAILFPDGSVIFSQSLLELNNLRSQRIAKIDKDSNVIWELPGLFHHDMILAEDGNIYSVGSKKSDSIPLIDHVKGKSVSFITGVVQVISPEGKLINSISIEDAFIDSGFENLLPLFDLDIEPQKTELKDGSTLYDPIHFNSIDYITAKQAKNLPFAKAGDLLISMRGNSAIAILRPNTNKIIWATRGPWRHQHYVQMTNKGTITLYDNDGGGFIANDKNGNPKVERQPRVLEFDPKTNKTNTLFYNKSDTDLYSYWRGYYKFIDTGNKVNDSMIVSSSNTGRIIQVDSDGNIIWELRTINDKKNTPIIFTKKIFSVKYYEKNSLKFLDCAGCTNN